MSYVLRKSRKSKVTNNATDKKADSHADDYHSPSRYYRCVRSSSNSSTTSSCYSHESYYSCCSLELYSQSQDVSGSASVSSASIRSTSPYKSTVVEEMSKLNIHTQSVDLSKSEKEEKQTSNNKVNKAKIIHQNIDDGLKEEKLKTASNTSTEPSSKTEPKTKTSSTTKPQVKPKAKPKRSSKTKKSKKVTKKETQDSELAFHDDLSKEFDLFRATIQSNMS